MSKAYLFYFLMFALAIAGLWVILTVGAAVPAPDDLSGDWNVRWQQPPPGVRGDTMRVSQSGRYFMVQFGAQPAMSMTLGRTWKGADAGRMLNMKLQGEVWTLDVNGAIPLGASLRVGEVTMRLSGPSEHAGVARRVGYEATTRPAGVAHAR
jgi:hypothetical protein